MLLLFFTPPQRLPENARDEFTFLLDYLKTQETPFHIGAQEIKVYARLIQEFERQNPTCKAHAVFTQLKKEYLSWKEQVTSFSSSEELDCYTLDPSYMTVYSGKRDEHVSSLFCSLFNLWLVDRLFLSWILHVRSKFDLVDSWLTRNKIESIKSFLVFLELDRKFIPL